MVPRRASLGVALLLLASAARSAQPPASITISGGVSLGSYEAGLVYYLVEAMRLNPAAATPRVVTGASAGSVNGFMTILQSCGGPLRDPPGSPLSGGWIPPRPGKVPREGPPTGKTSAVSRAPFRAPPPPLP